MVKVHFCVFGGEASNHFKLSQELSHPSRVSLPRYPLSQDSHHGGLCNHRSVLCPGSPASWGEGAPTGPLLPHGLRASVRAPRPRPPPLPSQLCSWKPIVLTGVALGLAAGHLPSPGPLHTPAPRSLCPSLPLVPTSSNWLLSLRVLLGHRREASAVEDRP